MKILLLQKLIIFAETEFNWNLLMHTNDSYLQFILFFYFWLDLRIVHVIILCYFKKKCMSLHFVES